MSFKETLARINELAHKSKKTDLTKEEKLEQKELRQEYLSGVRSSFKEQFKTLTVIDPEGNDVTPDKVKALHNKDNIDK